MPKMTIVGVELSEGVSAKSSREYSIGQLHTMIALAPPSKESNLAKGQVGSSYECPAPLLRKIAHLPFPIAAEVSTEDVMRYGKRQTMVTDIHPVERIQKAA